MESTEGKTVGVEVQVDVSGLQQKLARVGQSLKPEAMLKHLGETLLYWINENYRSQGAVFGGWAPLKPNTLAARRRGEGGNEGPSPIQSGRDTSRLASSFVVGKEGNVFKMGDSTVTVGTNVEYAKYQHFGTSGPYQIPKYRLRYKTDKNGRRYVVPLAFMTVDGLIFRKKVMHPGLPARRLVPDEEKGREIATNAVNAFVKRALELSNAKD